jgi:hypothetical protein
MSISEEAHEVGKNLLTATPATIAATINGALSRFIGDHFKSDSGHVVDCDGKRSERFASVIHLPVKEADCRDPASIPADATAAVLDVRIDPDLEELRDSYRRVAEAKSFKKTPVPKGETRTNVTLGVVVGVRSAVSLEAIAGELEQLNGQTPSNQWPDMILIASTGVINYAVQFPGESISGDFLPPAEGAMTSFTPPMYIVTVMRPTGDYAFNKMLAFLLAHLGIFAPGAKLPAWNPILEGVTQNVVTLTGYQYNLHGDLLPVPQEFYNDRYLPPAPVRIEDQQGQLLSTVQFLPWQDGGTVLLRGQLPLEGLLIFLGKDVLKRGGVVNRPDEQISYVLPIKQADFNEWLNRIQRQSNMRVRRDPGRFIVQKLADEGASSPFMARIMMGVMRLRDAVFPEPASREEFDKLYEYVTSALFNARDASQKIGELWEGHARKVTTGEIVRHQGQHIHIAENIDRDLRTEVESFLNAATRAFKTGMQNLGKELGVDVGFLFQQQGTFEKGLAALKQNDPDLAEYLRETRVWSEPLMESRIDLEHGTWVLPRIAYRPVGGGMEVGEPLVAGKPVSEFVSFSFDRLTCFVEEFTCHCLQRRMPAGITITEIALAERPAEAPERFRVTLAEGGLPAWRIAFHASPFDEA